MVIGTGEMIHGQLFSEEWFKKHADFLSRRIVFICFTGEPSWSQLYKLSVNIVAAVDASIIGYGAGRWLKNKWNLLKKRQEEILNSFYSRTPDFIVGMYSGEDEDDDD